MTLKQYASLLWHWSWLIVLGTAVAGGTAYIASQNTAPLYRATSQLYVEQGIADSEAVAVPNLAPTYAEMLQTRPILEETIVHLNLAMTTEQLAEMLTISVPENTQLITINVNDTNSERAALIANTVSHLFINQNQARNSQRYAEPIANWQQEVEAISAEIAALKANPTAQTDAQLENAQMRHTAALNSLIELQVVQASEGSTVIQVEAAQSSQTPVLPHTATNVGWAAIIGAVGATTIILLFQSQRAASEETAVSQPINQTEGTTP